MIADPVEDFVIADQRIAPGEQRRFDLPMAQLYTHTQLEMSIEVMHGRKPGPVLLVCAAIHGDELNGIEIIRRLREIRSLNRLHGTLVLVPVVNVFGLIHQSRYLPDRRDLNRCFPGSPQGSLGARMAHLFFTEVVEKCSHVIDLHTAAIHRDNQPQIRAALDEVEVEKMALGFSIPVIINSGLIEGTLRAEAGKRGIPVITYESGEALRLDESCIITGVRGIVNVMRTLSMLAPRGQRSRAEPYVANASSWHRAPLDGLFQASVKLGARVEKGQALGTIRSPYSQDEEIVPARNDGIIICVNKMPLVNEGDALFHVARFSKPDEVEDEIDSHGQVIESDRLFGL